jgi:hypothetical protein
MTHTGAVARRPRERGQRCLGPAQHRVAVGEQEEVELELEQPGVCVAQPPIGPLGVVQEAVGDEPERVLGPASHDSIRARQRPMARNVQGGLVRTNRVHLVDVDLAGQLVPEVKRLHRAAPVELVHAVADAVTGAAERLS